MKFERGDRVLINGLREGEILSFVDSFDVYMVRMGDYTNVCKEEELQHLRKNVEVELKNFKGSV